MTATVPATGRRELRFANWDEVLAELDRLALGPYERRGNWSLGKIADHLARTMEASLDGPDFQAPSIFRWVGPLLKRWVLYHRGMRPGFRLPQRVERQIIVADEVPDAEGVARLRHVIERFRREPPRPDWNGYFGRMSAADTDFSHRSHAALHLGFLVPGDPAK